MNAIALKSIAEIVQAFAALLWPIVALVAIILFKNPIVDLLYRAKRGKILGQELELTKTRRSIK